MRRKRIKKTLIIGGFTIILLIVAAALLSIWAYDYSVEMAQNTIIPEPKGALPVIRSDSTGWPSWKGMSHNNHAAPTKIITDWSNGLELLWKVEYLCRGEQSITWSCPAISGNHLIVPGRHDSTDVIFCLDPQRGHLLWSFRYDAPVANSSFGEGPRATPTIDGDLVYVLSRGGQLFCLRLQDGTEKWHRNYLDMGGEEPKWGFAASPVVYGNSLVVQVGGQALVWGLDKQTGETLWQSEPAPDSYSTPAVIQHRGETILLVVGGQDFFALDANTGATLWKTPWAVQNNINICTPVYSPQHGIAIITSWYNKGTQATHIIGRDSAEILWHTNALNAHQTDPIIVGDYIYGFSGMSAHNNDEFKCLNIHTGEEQWTSSAIGSGQFIFVDPFFLSIDIKGNLYLLLPSPVELTIITSIKNLVSTDNARLWTKPIIAQGNLYLRYANQLYCYRIANT
ncbi:PQQ-binding-like beta-propeller repeat protein [candidate division KSB1 bacterium]|nr:PQQ-binding-like beta-propeller repeat protein [candidate division KSB1 bacterium]RQW09097.1 MAG: hypothetical protein EH222_04510 [candidate division KSB1 bacterium]